MSFQAEFIHGNPVMEDYTPGSAVSAGDVVVISDKPRIAHKDIAASTLGALAVRGGVYKCPKATGTSTAIASGKKVYWDDTNNVVTETSTSNKLIGESVNTTVDADTHQHIYHDPQS